MNDRNQSEADPGSSKCDRLKFSGRPSEEGSVAIKSDINCAIESEPIQLIGAGGPLRPSESLYKLWCVSSAIKLALLRFLRLLQDLSASIGERHPMFRLEVRLVDAAQGLPRQRFDRRQ